MTRFHYTPDMQETVTKALGDKWERTRPTRWTYTPNYDDVDYHIHFDYHEAFKALTSYVMLGDGRLYYSHHARLLALRVKLTNQIWAEYQAASDRLRAAGLKEVDE